MPVTAILGCGGKKREREDNVTDGEVPTSKRVKREFYKTLDNIGYIEDHHHILFRTLPDSIDQVSLVVGRHVVGLLNSDGGILAFGVRPNGTIYGEKINRSEEDMLKRTIDYAITRITPCVQSEQYRVKFTPTIGKHFEDFSSSVERKVLEIKVSQGGPYELYEDQNHEAFRLKNCRLLGPLTPHEIKEITIKQEQRRCAEILGLPSSPVLTTSTRSLPTIVSKTEEVVPGRGHKELVNRAISKPQKIQIKRTRQLLKTESDSIERHRVKDTLATSSSESEHETPLPALPAPSKTIKTLPPAPAPSKTTKTLPPALASSKTTKTQPPAPVPSKTTKTLPPAPAPSKTIKTLPPAPAPSKTIKTLPPALASSKTTKTQPPAPAPSKTMKTLPPTPVPFKTIKTLPPTPAPSNTKTLPPAPVPFKPTERPPPLPTSSKTMEKKVSKPLKLEVLPTSKVPSSHNKVKSLPTVSSQSTLPPSHNKVKSLPTSRASRSKMPPCYNNKVKPLMLVPPPPPPFNHYHHPYQYPHHFYPHDPPPPYTPYNNHVPAHPYHHSYHPWLQRY